MLGGAGGFRTIHVFENDIPRGYDFLPTGEVRVGKDDASNPKWLHSNAVQKKGQYIYIHGLMRDLYATSHTGRLKKDRDVWYPWSLQVCDGNVMSSNCLNMEAFIDPPSNVGSRC